MAIMLNIFNSIADSNLAYYLLVIILLVVVVSMVYLIYSQNKEIREARKEREEEVMKSISSNKEVDMVDDLASEVEETKEESSSTNVLEKEQLLDIIKNDMEKKKANLILHDKREDVELTEPIISEKTEELDLEKVEHVEDVSLSNEKKMELIDATLTNIPRVSLLEETMTSIPPILEYSEETQELMNITKELENVPKERTIELTPYEEEQEQTAIISYDELINQEGVVYDDVTTEDGLSIKKVDLNNTPDISNDVASDVVPRETYAHEELFLSRLKSLQSKIN